jgi:hypothetical protein
MNDVNMLFENEEVRAMVRKPITDSQTQLTEMLDEISRSLGRV